MDQLPPSCRGRRVTPEESAEAYYRRTVYNPFLDYIVTDLRARFQSHSTKALNLCKLLPHELKERITTLGDLQETVQMYKHVIPEVDSLDIQLEMWTCKWQDVNKDDCPKTAVEALDHIDLPFMPTIHALLRFLATLPVTTCTVERSFSALKYLKNYLRTTMTEDRLTGLALLYIHRDIPIDIDDIINRFGNSNRRLNFL